MSVPRAIWTPSRRELSSRFFSSCKARRRRKFTPFWQKHKLVSFLVGLRIYQHPYRTHFNVFLGVFIKLRKATSNLVMSRLSVRMGQVDSRWTDFCEILYLRGFRKSVEKIQVSLKSDNNNGYFTWWSVHIIVISRWILLRMRSVPGKTWRENQNTNVIGWRNPTRCNSMQLIIYC